VYLRITNTYDQKLHKALFVRTINVLADVTKLLSKVSALMLAIIGAESFVINLLSKNDKPQYIQNCNFACFVWVWSLVSDTEGGT